MGLGCVLWLYMFYVSSLLRKWFAAFGNGIVCWLIKESEQKIRSIVFMYVYIRLATIDSQSSFSVHIWF